MAIDGRTIKRDEDPQIPPDPYAKQGLRWVAVGGFSVVAIFLLWLVYWTGTFVGGWVGGVLSVVSTALTVWLLWLWGKRKRR